MSLAVTALILSFHSEPEAVRAVRSLTAAAEGFDGPFHIYVADAAGTNTAELRAALGDEHVIALERNDGYGGNMNAAWRAVCTPVAGGNTNEHALLFLNCDLRFAAGFVAALARAHDGHSILAPVLLRDDGASALPGDGGRPRPDAMVEAAGAEISPAGRHRQRYAGARYDEVARAATRDKRGRMAVDVVHGTALWTPAALFERLGGFERDWFLYFEDADYCRRAALAGAGSYVVPDAAAWHQGAATLGAGGRFYYATRSHVAFQRRWGDPNWRAAGTGAIMLWNAARAVREGLAARSPRGAVQGVAGALAGAADNLRGRDGPRSQHGTEPHDRC